jgi:hypothetical protein
MRVRSFVLTPFRDGTVRRFLFVSAVAFWLGGFTFYSGVVIHVGHRVLGSALRQGFVTQRVTDWLNLAGVAALAVMLWNVWAVWPAKGRLVRVLLLATWIGMAAVQAELFALHPVMDRLLDAQARQVLDYDRFDALHRVYLLSASAQWAAGVLHVWCAVAGGGM